MQNETNPQWLLRRAGFERWRSKQQSPENIKRRFWSKVDKNGPTPEHQPRLGPCWIWLAHRNPNWHGLFTYFGRDIPASRVAYIIEVGDPGNLLVCHHCDNPICVNPSHLFLGTNLDNHVDMERKGRRASFRGRNNGMAKLSEESVKLIRTDYRPRIVTIEALAKRFGVTKKAVLCVIQNKTWIDVK